MSAPARSRAARRDAALGLAMGVANALGLLVVVLLARPLGPARFGAFSALSGIGVVLAIPAGALQVVLARRAALPHARTSGLRTALVTGCALAAVTAAASLPLASALHLGSVRPVLWLGLTLIPMMLTGCAQGLLLGTGRLRSLSGLYLVTAGARVAAAAATAAAGWGVEGAVAAQLAAAVAAAGWGLWRCRDLLPTWPPGSPGLTREVLTSNAALASFAVLTGLDVVLARRWLPAPEAGGYALAATFGRAVAWGTQFVALLVLPRLHVAGARRRLLRSAAVVAAAGAVATALVAAAPRWWITLAGGAEYTGHGALVVACTAVGTAWALAQLWLLSARGRAQARLSALVWLVAAVQAVAVATWFHDGPWAVLGVSAAGAWTVATAGLAGVLRRPGPASSRRSAPPDGA